MQHQKFDSNITDSFTEAKGQVKESKLCIEKEMKTFLSSIAQQALLAYQLTTLLPEPLTDYKINITLNGAFALFDLFDKNSVLSISVVAWDDKFLAEKWRLFVTLCWNLAKRHDCELVLTKMTMPLQLPWLVTFTLPNVLYLDLSEIEYCLANALIQE